MLNWFTKSMSLWEGALGQLLHLHAAKDPHSCLLQVQDQDNIQRHSNTDYYKHSLLLGPGFQHLWYTFCTAGSKLQFTSPFFYLTSVTFLTDEMYTNIPFIICVTSSVGSVHRQPICHNINCPALE